MIKRLLITIVCVLFLMPSSFATRTPASRHWEASFFGGGGTFPDIFSDYEIANTLYLTSDVSGFLKSSDGAENWSFMNNGVTTIINTTLEQSYYNPDILFGIGNKLLKSINRGKTWFPIGDYKATRGKVHKGIAIGRTNPNLVFVALDNGKIMRSTDGQTFSLYATPFGTNKFASFVYLDPTDSHLIVGSGQNLGMKIYNLSDDSVSDITLTGTNSEYNWDFDTYKIGGVEHFCVTAGLKIACTTDFQVWDYTEEANSNSLFFISKLTAQYLSDTTIRFLARVRQVSTQYGTSYLMRSADGGATWTNVQGNATVNTTDNPSQIWGTFGDVGNIG